MLPGVGRWPMPCADANGLLPGRGPAGRCPMPCADEKGLLPGRGAPPGRGACGVLAPGVAGAAGAASAAGEQPERREPPASREPAWRPRRAWPVRRASPVRDARRAGARRGGLGSRPPPGRQRSLLRCALGLEGRAELARHRGAMVDEGLLTYSPSSFSFARATLLSTPISEAISCTRGFATILLSEVSPDRADRYLRTGLISSRSLCVHSRSAVSLVGV
jgi:hypothetical protein